MSNDNLSSESGFIFRDDLREVDWEKASLLFERAPLGRNKRDPVQLQKAFESSYTVVIVYASGQLAGMCRALCDGQYQAAIYDIVLLPEYHGNGIGKQMLEKLCEKLPVENIILYSVPGKEGFYSKCGFRKMKTAMARLNEAMSDPSSGYLLDQA